MRTAKQCVEIFSNMDKEEPIGLWYLDKSDVLERLEGMDLEDKDGNLIDIQKLVTNSFVQSVIDRVNNDDSVWEGLGESIADAIDAIADRKVKEMEEDKELWDTEQENNNG